VGLLESDTITICGVDHWNKLVPC